MPFRIFRTESGAPTRIGTSGVVPPGRDTTGHAWNLLVSRTKCARQDSNLRPSRPKRDTLSAELRAHFVRDKLRQTLPACIACVSSHHYAKRCWRAKQCGQVSVELWALMRFFWATTGNCTQVLGATNRCPTIER